ncbi:MAG TPA: DUF2795 domain-containing protein [Acidimicrobiales bacterium]|nr:DUF2795 domain-containing protein [Acidimicrobiales bacterium]
MDRESNKHSPRVDEALAHDVDSLLHGSPEESRAQEGRLQEDPGVGPGRRFDDPVPGTGLTEADLQERAELSSHLAAAHFPARRDELVAAAREDHAPEDVVRALGELPPDEEYETVQAVWQALGGNVEPPHAHHD